MFYFVCLFFNKTTGMLSCFSGIQLFAAPWTVAPSFLCSWDCPGKNTQWIAMPPSIGSSWPRDWTLDSYVSCTGKWVLYQYHHLGHPNRTIIWYNFFYTDTLLIMLVHIFGFNYTNNEYINQLTSVYLVLDHYIWLKCPLYYGKK